MTETTKEIFDRYEVRKTVEQKRSFRNYVRNVAEKDGYKVSVEKASRRGRNIIVGDPESAKVVYTAHYDTCAIMPLPNFITPRSIPIYILYQLFLSTVIYIIPILSTFVVPSKILDRTGSHALFGLCTLLGYSLIVLVTYLMMAGPANRHTANDNTSGVTLLLDLMRDMPNELREDVAYIFFDLEECGMIGSKGYAARHKAMAKRALILNFDCVSDGKNILFAVRKKANNIAPTLTEAFAPSDGYAVEIATKGVFYPSDQYSFDHGVGVAALKKTKRGLLYINRIHTPRDNVYDEANIAFLKSGAIRFATLLV